MVFQVFNQLFVILLLTNAVVWSAFVSNHSTSATQIHLSLSQASATQNSSIQTLPDSTSVAQAGLDEASSVTSSPISTTKLKPPHALGNYIAKGLGMTSGSTGFAVIPDSQESSASWTASTQPNSTKQRSQSRTPLTVGSSIYTEVQVGTHVFGNQTSIQESHGIAINRTLITILDATAGTSSTNNLTTSYTNTSYMDPPRFCATAVPKDPVQKAAIDCYCSQSSWHSSFSSFSLAGKSWSSGEIVVPRTGLPETVTSTFYPTNVTPYTLCDGVPRIDDDPVTNTTVLDDIETLTWTIPMASPYLPIQPTCSAGPAGCRYLYYNASMPGDPARDDALLAMCGLPAHLGSPCLLGGGPIRLFYWPQPSDPDRICKASNRTDFPHANIHYGDLSETNQTAATVETLGTTFTYGTVYMSFQTLYASYDGFWDRVGPTFSDYIMPLSSSEIRTICFDTPGRETGNVLDFRDLNRPVPSSAYSCAGGCGRLIEYSSTKTRCTIWDNYDPILALPTSLTDHVPQWKTCRMWDDNIHNFWYDPPQALTPQPAPASPTNTFSPTPTAARPNLPILTTGPRSTAVPVQHSSTPQAEPTASTANSQLVPTSVSSLPGAPSPIESSFSVDSGTEIPPVSLPKLHSSTAADPSFSDSTAGIVLPTTGPNTRTASLLDTPNSSAPTPAGPVAPIMSMISYTSDPTPPTSDDPQLSATIDSQTVSMNNGDASGIVIGGETLSIGQKTVIDGHTASMASTAIVVDGSSTFLFSSLKAPSSNDPAYASVSETQAMSIVQDPNTFLSIGSKASVNIDPQPSTAASTYELSDIPQMDSVTFGTDGTTAIINGQSISVALPSIIKGSAATYSIVSTLGPAASAAVFITDTEVITALPMMGHSGVDETGSSSITIGSSVIVIDSTPDFAIGSDTVIDGGHDGSFDGFTASSITQARTEATIIHDGYALTVLETSVSDRRVAVVGDVTITIGDAPATVSGFTILAKSNGIVVDGSSTALFTTETAIGAADDAEATLTVGSRTLVASEVLGHSNEVIVDGSMMTMGGSAAVVNGQTISMASSDLVFGGNSPSTAATLGGEGIQISDAAPTSTPSGGAKGSYSILASSASSPSSVTTSSGRKTREIEIRVWLELFVSICMFSIYR